MDRLTTGIAELDRVLGGGIVPGSLVVLAGAPGTGKTILAQQICFANATTESPGIYYTTQSESHQKMIHHLEGLSFFERGALGERVVFNNLASITPGGHDVSAVSDEVIRSAFDRHPSVIVIDSARALHTAANHDDFRRIIYDLASKVSHSEAILVFVGEYLPNEIGEAPEFAVADVIVTMSNETEMAGDRRWMRVLKVRGSDYMSGRHPFKIGSSGIELTPRAEAFPVGERPALEGRLSTGIPGLDEMMGGGIPAGDVTLIAGPSGAGKTVMSLSFAADGIERNEPVLYLTFQESERQLISRARTLGRDLERGNLLDVVHVNPVEVGLDAVAAEVRRTIEGPAGCPTSYGRCSPRCARPVRRRWSRTRPRRSSGRPSNWPVACPSSWTTLSCCAMPSSKVRSGGRWV
jgi:circadian clock protein KaiC